ncbi:MULTISPECIES: aspartate dehydrogenase [unclassified Devosia]|uniref:aspartate dehydrogenase n=1 Tax=unclassified Devosia TaxID=196773 RepID=UPI0032BF2C1D
MIGLGAMARSLIGALEARGDGLAVGAALVRSPAEAGNLEVFSTVEQLIGWGPSLVVECAGHEAVARHVPALLKAGVPVVVASVGALADPELRTRVAGSVTAAGRLTLVPGAIGGLDVLRAARLAGLDAVVYCGTKPPQAWAGSHAETLVALGSITEAAEFFSGTAAEAARLFPKNANVCAAVALSGLGFEATQVRLVADPAAGGNRHEVLARGAFGQFEIALENAALPDNPRTSWLAALSVEAAVREFFAASPIG